MLFVAHVLVLEIRGWQILDSVRFSDHLMDAEFFYSHWKSYIYKGYHNYFNVYVQVLIDESTQATEPECLIPLIMGVKQVEFMCQCY